jgi:hypothetical protein
MEGGTLDMYGSNLSIGNLTGSSGLITSSAVGSDALAVHEKGASTYYGDIENGVGNMELIAEGGGLLTLAGSTTTVNFLVVTGDSTLVLDGGITPSGHITILPGSTLTDYDSSVTYDETGLGTLYIFGTLNENGGLASYYGTVEVKSGGHFNIDSTDPMVNNSTLTVYSGGAVTDYAGTTNDGSITVNSGGTWYEYATITGTAPIGTITG